MLEINKYGGKLWRMEVVMLDFLVQPFRKPMLDIFWVVGGRSGDVGVGRLAGLDLWHCVSVGVCRCDRIIRRVFGYIEKHFIFSATQTLDFLLEGNWETRGLLRVFRSTRASLVQVQFVGQRRDFAADQDAIELIELGPPK